MRFSRVLQILNLAKRKDVDAEVTATMLGYVVEHAYMSDPIAVIVKRSGKDLKIIVSTATEKEKPIATQAVQRLAILYCVFFKNLIEVEIKINKKGNLQTPYGNDHYLTEESIRAVKYEYSRIYGNLEANLKES